MCYHELTYHGVTTHKLPQTGSSQIDDFLIWELLSRCRLNLRAPGSAIWELPDHPDLIWELPDHGSLWVVSHAFTSTIVLNSYDGPGYLALVFRCWIRMLAAGGPLALSTLSTLHELFNSSISDAAQGFGGSLFGSRSTFAPVLSPPALASSFW